MKLCKITYHLIINSQTESIWKHTQVVRATKVPVKNSAKSRFWFKINDCRVISALRRHLFGNILTTNRRLLWLKYDVSSHTPARYTSLRQFP